jgi:hypothetical protein
VSGDQQEASGKWKKTAVAADRRVSMTVICVSLLSFLCRTPARLLPLGRGAGRRGGPDLLFTIDPPAVGSMDRTVLLSRLS